MQFLGQEAFAGFTFLQVGIALIALVAVTMLWSKFAGKKQNTSHLAEASCGCGWKGKVGKHARRCPKCNANL